MRGRWVSGDYTACTASSRRFCSHSSAPGSRSMPHSAVSFRVLGDITDQAIVVFWGQTGGGQPDPDPATVPSTGTGSCSLPRRLVPPIVVTSACPCRWPTADICAPTQGALTQHRPPTRCRLTDTNGPTAIVHRNGLDRLAVARWVPGALLPAGRAAVAGTLSACVVVPCPPVSTHAALSLLNSPVRSCVRRRAPHTPRRSGEPARRPET